MDTAVRFGSMWDLGLAASCWRRCQLRHAQQVVGGGGQRRMQCDARGADEARLAQPAVSLEPTEDLFDPLAFALTDRVARVPRGSRIQARRAPALNPRHVRSDAALAAAGDELAHAVALVGPQGLGRPAPAPRRTEQP